MSFFNTFSHTTYQDGLKIQLITDHTNQHLLAGFLNATSSQIKVFQENLISAAWAR